MLVGHGLEAIGGQRRAPFGEAALSVACRGTVQVVFRQRRIPRGFLAVVLSEIDRNLLERCLGRKPRAWEDFVDRFIGLVFHVVHHTAQARSVRLTSEDRDDLCAEVFLRFIKDDFAILRRFRGQSSLATYLTVVARRVVVREMMTRTSSSRLGEIPAPPLPKEIPEEPAAEPRFVAREEVDRLLSGLPRAEAEIVRLYHLEGKSYRDIAAAVGVAENSIGPILSRARARLKELGLKPAAR